RDDELRAAAASFAGHLGAAALPAGAAVARLRVLGHDQQDAMSVLTYALAAGVLVRRGSAILAAPRSRTVLVVDDDVEARAVGARILGEEGYEIATAGDGLEALDRIRRARPDVVVFDLVMPRMDGWQLVAELRRDPPLATLPLVAVSATAVHRNPRPPEGVAVLPKPLDFYGLIAAIERALEGNGPLGSVTLDC
ncbi:MAG TPA: response regulator, partial [Minicystis sp.]|nr:response regulator [Minicystis sp.]